MDPDQDQSKSSSYDEAGSIRWVDDPTSPIVSSTSTTIPLSSSQSSESTSTCSTSVVPGPLHNKVTYYEKVWSSGHLSGDGADETDRANFSMDVHAFERRMQEERERKTREQSPRIDIKLRSTPQPSPRPTDLPLPNVQVNIRHHIESTESPIQEKMRKEETVETHEYHHKRVTKYEKVITKKSSHKVNVKTHVTTSSSMSPTTIRTIEHTEFRPQTPSSSEHVASPSIDDSAYQSERIRIVRGASTPTGAPTSPSSHSSLSNASLHGNFTSDENVYARQQMRTPSRERIYFERAGSEPRSWSSSGVATTASPVSSVAISNEFVRRHLVRERRDSGDSDGASSSDWYNEYRSQSFHTTAPRMDFKRSNSQYDRHIQEIRGKKKNK